MSGRILAVGDLHGCALTLESMLNQIGLMHDDQIVFLGDYVDRGDKSFETVQRLIELQEEYGDEVVTFLKGNHEDMFINCLKGTASMDEWRMFRYNGGTSTNRSYLEGLGYHDKSDILWDDLPESHQKFYDNLKVYHQIDRYVFVHAGVQPNVKLEDQTESDMIWIRDNFLYWPMEVLPGYFVVHGHTPMEREEIDHYNEKYHDKFNLDSACVYGYELTCRDLTNDLVIRVECLDKRVA